MPPPRLPQPPLPSELAPPPIPPPPPTESPVPSPAPRPEMAGAGLLSGLPGAANLGLAWTLEMHVGKWSTRGMDQQIGPLGWRPYAYVGALSWSPSLRYPRRLGCTTRLTSPACCGAHRTASGSPTFVGSTGSINQHWFACGQNRAVASGFHFTPEDATCEIGLLKAQ